MPGKLLIVDDEPELRELFAEVLEELADRIDIAEDGPSALKLIETTTYDAICSDLKMPRMSGIDVLRQIRAKGVHTPFVVITGYGEKQDAIEALRLGVFDFIDKPVKNEILAETIREALDLGLSMNQLEKELREKLKLLDPTEGSKQKSRFESLKEIRMAQTLNRRPKKFL